MANNESTLEVTRREERGTNANRRLRRQGEVPAVVYGAGLEPLAIRVPVRAVQRLLKASGENAVFLLKLQGTEQSRHTMIKELQLDPLNDSLVHIDFQRVRLDEKVRVSVAIDLVGTAFGVKNEGGLVDFVTRQLEIECLPTAIPARLELDVSDLHVGQHVEAGQVALPEGVALVDEPTKVIASITLPRVAVSEAAEAEGELIETTQEEPEVIHRGKEEES